MTLSPALDPVLRDPPEPLIAHLAELRKRLIASLVFLAAGSAVAYRFSEEILACLARPVGQLVFVAPTEAFGARLRISLWGGLVLALPLMLHQTWLFVERAVDSRWRRIVLRLLPLSYLLFLAGAALGLWGVVPLAMRFLLSFGTDSVKPLLTLGAYAEFVTGICLAFGAVFQLPLVLYALNRAGAVSRRTLARWRGPAYLLCAVGGALLTPGPDVSAQVLLMVPAALLFELSLLAMD